MRPAEPRYQRDGLRTHRYESGNHNDDALAEAASDDWSPEADDLLDEDGDVAHAMTDALKRNADHTVHGFCAADDDGFATGRDVDKAPAQGAYRYDRYGMPSYHASQSIAAPVAPPPPSDVPVPMKGMFLKARANWYDNPNQGTTHEDSASPTNGAGMQYQ